MRQLRFVRSADDGTHVVVETADGGEQFSLALDPALRDAARADLPRPASGVAEPEPALGPREIQVRVRAGESPQELADASQMALERILRFAGPVLEERARITHEARRARARRGTADGQAVVFGEAVDERFTAHGIDPATVGWDARRRADGAWLVDAQWRDGECDRRAEWTLHLPTRIVTPVDDTAADLLSDRPIRPALHSAPPLAPGVVAFPVMPDAQTGPLPVADDVFDQAAHDPDAPRRGRRPASPPRPTPVAAARASTQPARPPAGPAKPAASAAAGAAADADHETLPLELGVPARRAVPQVKNLGVAHRPESGERSARPQVPSWDDILLGVRRKHD